MGRLLLYTFLLVISVVIGLVGYSFFGDISPRQGVLTVPVETGAYQAEALRSVSAWFPALAMKIAVPDQPTRLSGMPAPGLCPV
ncbi:MAG: hypothetical protein GDA53_03040 [Rhodobacteraceae bacterium]|nr:hypothetical protein [Paracoccaceae bacterium]